MAVLAVCLGATARAARAQDYVMRLPEPPANFDPLTASNEALARYGLPVRPAVQGSQGALAYATWARVAAAARHRIDPVIRMTNRRHGPARRTAQSVAAGNAASYNWAGQILLNGVTGFGWTSFAEILAQWVVPRVQQPPGACAGTDYSSLWVGIDGWTGADGGDAADVLQAGTEQDAACDGGTTSATYYPWFEWYPQYEYEITNFPVSPGDGIFVVVQATSPTTAQATFVNFQTNQYAPIAFSAPSGIQLLGNSAEWIAERPSVNNALTSLADFGMTMMAAEISYPALLVGTQYSDSPEQYGSGVAGSVIVMQDSAGNALATPFPQGPSADVLEAEGSAR